MNYNHPPSTAHHMAPAVPGASHWRALATAYGIMDLIGAFGLFSVLVASVFTKRLRRNPVLLNFHLLFFVTALGGSLMVLAGRAFDQHPPRRICTASGIFISAAATGKAAAAFALTCQVWAHVMMLSRPNSRPLAIIASSRLLIPLPWIIYLVMLFVATGFAAAKPHLVSRSSVYYCQINSRTITVINYAIAAVFEVVTLILAGWIGFSVLHVRRCALAAQSTRRSPVYRALAIRTTIFGGVLFFALILEIASLLVHSVKLPIPGMIVAVIDLLAFIVFASDPVALRFFFARVRSADDTVSRSAPSGRPLAVSVQVTRTAPTGDFDEEAGWDVPGAHSLHTLPKDPIGSVDDVTGGPPGLDAKVVL